MLVEAMANHPRGFRTLTYEIKDSTSDVNQDILSDEGFLTVVTYVLKLRRVGLCFMAPVCSRWCWLSRHTSGRTIVCPLGNPMVQSVEEGNLMVSRTILLIHLLLSKRCMFVIEQPMGSVMEQHPRFAALIESVDIWRVLWSCCTSSKSVPHGRTSCMHTYASFMHRCTYTMHVISNTLHGPCMQMHMDAPTPHVDMHDTI